MEICRLKGVDMGEDLEKFIEKYPTYIEALEMLEDKDQRIAELEQELAKYKDLQDRLGLENVDEFEWFVMLDLLTDNEKNMHILDLHRELAELKEKAIVPKFKHQDYVYAICSYKDIFKGQIDVFDYYSNTYFIFFGKDIGSDWFSENLLFTTEEEAQDKLKEIKGNE